MGPGDGLDLMLACVASVSNRVSFPSPSPVIHFFALVPAFYTNLARKRLLRRLIWCLTPYQFMGSLGRPASMEGLNRVNRQPPKKVRYFFIVNRQKCRLILIVQKFQGISVLLFSVFQLIIMDFWFLKNPAPHWKTSSYVLKNTPSRLYKTLEIAYIWNYFEIL